ncbi:MAG TPA: thioesterase family protein [Burkholderiaceae bacterium]
MTLFSALLASMSHSDGHYQVAPGEGWGQGRTLYGGITLAVAAHAARLAFPDLPPLRGVQAAFTGPASGVLTMKPVKVAAGKSSAFIAVDIHTEAGTALRATFCYGVARQSRFSHSDLGAPPAARPEDCPGFFRSALAPQFTAQFDGRLAGKAGMFAGSDDPDLLTWIRHIDTEVTDAEAGLIALADALPPAVMLMFTEPSPISTATWSMEILTENYANSGWHLLRTQAEHVGEGYSSQHMNVWDEAGRPLMVGRQLVTIYR